MSYIKPSPLIYQDLQSSGGVLNSTPDLEACIVGPAYNVIKYIPGSVSSQVQTAAKSTVSTLGSITVATKLLTVASTGGFSVGDTLLIEGAGSSGSVLATEVVSMAGNVITLGSNAATTVADAGVTKKGSIASTVSSNVFEISGAKVGQEVEGSSIKVWLDNVRVNTLNTGMEGYVGGISNTQLYCPSLSTVPTSNITSGSTSAVLANVRGLGVGDSFTIAGAGAAGALYTGKVTGITDLTVTFTPATSTNVTTSAAVTKVVPINLNSSTNTLKVESGDEVIVSYTDNLGAASTFESKVRSVVTSSGVNGSLESLSLTDSLPDDLCKEITGDTTSGSAVVQGVSSTAGIATGVKVLVKGAGVSGANVLATVVSFIADTSITLSTTLSTTISDAVVVVYNSTITMSIVKTYEDQILPITKPLSGGANYSTANVGTDNEITINADAELVYGRVLSGDVYFEYKALRKDLTGILSINDINDLVGKLGNPHDENPLALGCQVALSNTITRIRAVAVNSNDLLGYQEAFEILEGERVYAIVPMTQDLSIISALKAHVTQMSTPENAAWRVGIVNSLAPTLMNIGQYSAETPNSNGGANSVTLIGSEYVLTSSNATFISDGVTPGDLIHYDAAVYMVDEVLSNQQLVISASATASAVSYYITRVLSKTQKAEAIAGVSENLLLNRMWHTQPDTVGVTVDGVVKYLPGYYLSCGLAGMVSGFPVQQGFTNIGVAGISDLRNSNFYFSKADLNNMAAAGTCLFVQDSQGSIPYCRHELTTDVSVLEYREMLVVKNWDFLSYFYYDKVKSFIGVWNITPDTLNTIRQTINASSELIKGQKLPRIGAPLLGYSITSLEQDAFNKDNANVVLKVEIVYPLNYLNIHIVI